MVKVKKTIKCKIIKPTKLKLEQLNKEYSYLQDLLQLESLGLDFLPIYQSLKEKVYAANLQQALRFYKKIKPNKEYPLSIRKDLIEIKKTDNKLAKYWIKIPTKQRRGGLKLAIKSQPFNFEDYEICESKLYKKKNEWYIDIVVQKEVKLNNTYSSVLALDLGEKYVCCSVNSADISMKPEFWGKEVRGIRRKYNYMRKQLGKKKLLKKIKEIGQKEKRKVNDCLHKISNAIVKQAIVNNSIIVLGNLKGIRKSAKGKGKRFNRIVNNMPYYKLTKMIEYKANWNGISVMKVSEAYTSITCSKCGSKGKRPYQGLFKCSECGYQVNADFNGAKNILKRSLEYISKDGAVMNQPKTVPMSTEAIFERW